MAFLIPATEAGERRIPDFLYSTFDQAIDTKRSDVDKYADTLEAKHLTPKPGKRLTKFEFRVIDEEVSERLECLAEASASLLSMLYFRSCVIRMHDVMLQDEDGTIKYGTAPIGKYVDRRVRKELGVYCRRLCTEVAPDFFGLSLPTSAEDSASSTVGATDA